jgi:hypothetical protein
VACHDVKMPPNEAPCKWCAKVLELFDQEIDKLMQPRVLKQVKKSPRYPTICKLLSLSCTVDLSEESIQQNREGASLIPMDCNTAIAEDRGRIIGKKGCNVTFTLIDRMSTKILQEKPDSSDA